MYDAPLIHSQINPNREGVQRDREQKREERRGGLAEGWREG